MASGYQYIISTGVIVPDTADLEQEVSQEYKDAFGDDLVTTPDTPQGVLITQEVLARSNVLQNNAQIANQINPDLAQGVFLDAIAKLTGLYRQKATATTVSVIVTGTPGTIIPTTAVAQTSTGYFFNPVSPITIDNTASASGVFQCTDTGPIVVSTGDLSIIVGGVLGWETISNLSPGLTGNNEESDEAFRIKRANSVAAQSSGGPESIPSALYQQNIGVSSVSFYENYTDLPLTVPDGSITLGPHSIYVCVDGGTNTDVANVLLAKKSAGCNWNGNTTVIITNPATSQQYLVKFDRPSYVPIVVRVYVRLESNFVGDPVKIVKKAILDYASGDLGNGELGLQIGVPVSCFELSGAINIEQPKIFVNKLEISLATPPLSYSTNSIPIKINERATISESSIEVNLI